MKVPLTKQQEANFRTNSDLKVGSQAKQLNAEVLALIQEADNMFATTTTEQQLRMSKKDRLAEAGVTEECALDMANRLTDLTLQTVDVAKEVLDWTKAGPARPFHYKTRQEQRKNWNMITYRTMLRQALMEYKCAVKQGHDQNQELDPLTSKIEELCSQTPLSYQEHFPRHPVKDNANAWHTWSKCCSKELGRVKQEKAQLQREHDAKQQQAASQKVQQTYRTNKKRINKQVLGNEAKQAMTALKDRETNVIHTEPAAVKQYVHDYFKHQSTPATGNTKTGDFLPEKVARQYPWKVGPSHKLDTFDLETQVGQQGNEQVSIENCIRDKSIFQEIVSELSKQVTGTTPDSWKASNTILLHNKNSELLLENYRPIALANTMYKLWTGVIQRTKQIR